MDAIPYAPKSFLGEIFRNALLTDGMVNDGVYQPLVTIIEIGHRLRFSPFQAFDQRRLRSRKSRFGSYPFEWFVRHSLSLTELSTCLDLFQKEQILWLKRKSIQEISAETPTFTHHRKPRSD